MQLTALLEDEHALRRLSGSTEANELSGMFEKARELAARLVIGELRQPTIAKLRIDPAGKSAEPDPQLIQLFVDAKEIQELVLGSPELGLNQLGKREGRCRTQLTKYLRFSWLSPRIVEAILTGNQPAGLKRTKLLKCELPIDWRAQEQLLGFAT